MIAYIKKYLFLNFIFLLLPSYIIACHAVIGTINVGLNPAGIAITPDNQWAYVANNNNAGFVGGDNVTVIYLKTNKPYLTISDSSFNEPYTVTINAEGTIAYVTNSGGSTITMIDIQTNKVIGTISGFDGPSGMVITPDGNTAYVNNYGGPIAGSGNGTTVSVVNLKTNTITSTITVGQAPAALAITPNGEFVYSINYVTGNPTQGTVSVIQTSNNTVVKTIPGFSGPFGIAITPNGKYAYVTNFGSNNFAPTGSTVSVIDLSTNTVIAAISVGLQPSGVAISPDGRFVYVTNYNTLYLGPNFTNLTAGVGTVSVIDACTNTLLCTTIIVGSSPANIALTCNGKLAYVTNYSSNNVSVVNISERMWLR